MYAEIPDESEYYKTVEGEGFMIFKHFIFSFIIILLLINT